MEQGDDINRGAKYLKRAEEIHGKFPLFDGHNGAFYVALVAVAVPKF